MLELYKNIKRRRQQLKMTQTDLALKMGYADKSMIAKIEKGNVDLPQSKIFVTEFREACEKLGIKQSAVFREAMEAVIEKAKKDQSN